MKQKTAIFFSGFLWLVVGVFLLFKGISLFSHAIENKGSLLLFVETRSSSLQSAISFLMALSLFLGFLKGRLIFSKTVDRQVRRILSFPEPISLSSLYPAPYWALIGVMMALGMLMRIFSVPSDIRAVVDTAVGSALMQGAIFYFRSIRLVPSKNYVKK